MDVSGVVVVDKPAGPTSHDVVDGVRRALKTRRVGHTGTLDPFATGVLPICVGKATRLARFLGGGEKVYRATIRLGFATATDDSTGEPLGAARPADVDARAWDEACAAFTGTIDQLPPLFSAKHVDGRRLYEMARAGEAVERRPSRVTVHAFRVLEAGPDRAEVEVTCSTGTYIRALARDVGERLGTGGHLAALRRLRSGSFSLDEAVTYPGLAGVREHLMPLASLLPDLPEVRVGEEGALAVRQGRDLDARLVMGVFPDEPAPRLRVVDEAGALLALAVPSGFDSPTGGPLPRRAVLHPDVVLAD